MQDLRADLSGKKEKKEKRRKYKEEAGERENIMGFSTPVLELHTVLLLFRIFSGCEFEKSGQIKNRRRWFISHSFSLRELGQSPFFV